MLQSLRYLCPRWLLSFHFCQASFWCKEEKEKRKKLECTYREEFAIRWSSQLEYPGKQLKKCPAFDFDLPQKCFCCLFQSNVIRWRKVKESERYWKALVTIVLFILCRCFMSLYFFSPWMLFFPFPNSLKKKKKEILGSAYWSRAAKSSWCVILTANWKASVV